MTAESPDSAACPTCGEICSLELAARTTEVGWTTRVTDALGCR
jgi:hypothetical protein